MFQVYSSLIVLDLFYVSSLFEDGLIHYSSTPPFPLNLSCTSFTFKQRRLQHAANKTATRHVRKVCAVMHGGPVDREVLSVDLDVNPTLAFVMQSVIHLVPVVL